MHESRDLSTHLGYQSARRLTYWPHFITIRVCRYTNAYVLDRKRGLYGAVVVWM